MHLYIHAQNIFLETEVYVFSVAAHQPDKVVRNIGETYHIYDLLSQDCTIKILPEKDFSLNMKHENNQIIDGLKELSTSNL